MDSYAERKNVWYDVDTRECEQLSVRIRASGYTIANTYVNIFLFFSTYHIFPEAVEERAHIKVAEAFHISSGLRVTRIERVILAILRCQVRTRWAAAKESKV